MYLIHAKVADLIPIWAIVVSTQRERGGVNCNVKAYGLVQREIVMKIPSHFCNPGFELHVMGITIERTPCC